ncbi:TetR/AcrR family transcriptional regulator [Jeotgalibacillus sp. ET6]|uniref:TetR/AcrR family transcriptional regulator n=1 Tax=Jeotgalibacillus sp. ET6 TaxID=3037260 RepID=UPI00241873A3|nr:TetR/AcrR family transcriptional regulator [Jeotgalibacillus sp. ET6]MDG5472841.1 TetR/AcrR family transcriptional regulator [Jeotgalibacillus sp. ET6]
MTEQKLRQAAIELFIEHGYEGTSIAKIVQKVGIRKSSFYAHFKSKGELFLAVYRDAVTKESERIIDIEKQLAEKDPVMQLHEIYINLSDPQKGGMETHFLHRMLFYPPVEFKSEMKVIFGEMEGQASQIIRRKIAQTAKNENDTENLLAVFYALIDGLAIESHLYTEEEYVKRQQAVWTVFRSNLT